MKSKNPLLNFLLVIINVFGVLSYSYAEVVLDGNLSLVPSNSEYKITEDLGQTSGNNLYHSFDQFNINTGETATFSGSSNIQNIISRVSGGDSSTIDGTLKSTISGANLWLLNSNGVLYGENATLDITGSFYTSTADYLKFENNEQYFTDSTNQNSVLSSANPKSFGFLSSDTSSIVINSTLAVNGTESINVVGGAINLYQSNLTVQNGKINLIANKKINEIDLSALSTMEITAADYADININESSLVATGVSNQGISIVGGKLVIADSQLTENSITQDQSKIEISGDVIVLSNTNIKSYDPSNLVITSDQLVVRDVNVLQNTGIIDASLNVDTLKVSVENANDTGLNSLLNSLDAETTVLVSITGELQTNNLPETSLVQETNEINLIDSDTENGAPGDPNQIVRARKVNEFNFGDINSQVNQTNSSDCRTSQSRQLLSTRQVLFQPMPGEFNPGSLYENIDLAQKDNSASARSILGIFSQCG